MEITIDDQRKIFAVQNDFSTMFPFLKLEFYSKPYKRGEAPSSKPIKHISKTIAECRTVHSSGSITIHPHITTGELEQHFMDVFGLTTHVFRKAGAVWIDTAHTNDLTLEKQNKEASETSRLEKTM
jgi:hypothetical protein